LSGLDDVRYEVQVNDEEVIDVNIPVSGSDDYSLNLDLTSISDNDVVSYRIVVHDIFGYEAVFPPSGSIVVPVLKNATALNTYSNNFNTATTDFIGNFFDIAKPSGFADNAIHSQHSYATGVGLDNTSSFNYILTKPVKINATNPYIRFDEVVIVEHQSAGIAFGTAAFNDYVIVEGSDDGGVTWKEFADGYDATGQSNWVSAFNSDSNGTPAMFKSRTINMLDNGNFSANDEVFIRFRLFSNATSSGWGWAIDNLFIQDAVTGVDDLISASTFITSPNPARDQLAIELSIPGNGVVDLGLYNIHGQAVIKQQESLIDGAMKTTMNVASLSDGFYFVKATIGNRQVVRKVIKTSK
jgi:hypothetical protein